MHPEIAAIVPVHNQLESTKKFLLSFYTSLDWSSAKGHCSLFIIDDGSTDGTYEWISEFHQEIIILRGDGGLWWSGSVNLALKHIINKPFSHFLLFNNDNILHLDYFTNLMTVIHSVGKHKIISSKVFNIYPEEHVIYGGITFNGNKSKYIANKNPNIPAIVNTAGGMGVLIPLEVIQRVGFFNAKNFPQKSGDTDFYLRAEKVGMKVHYQPCLVVYNDNSITGFSDNSSFRGLAQAYSFPKGYMNLKVDLKLFLSHGNPFWAVYRVLKNNLIFIVVGLVRIVKSFINNPGK